ncbi:MAG: molybdopterin molybdotransferase MoeA [Micrococcales bacterium]|nr:molybdopterin molybdotransferase MoeA [Micrococcales bacterium]
MPAYRTRVVNLAALTDLRRRPLSRCLGRVLGEPVHALVDVPGFDSSAMDGFALRHTDTGRVQVDCVVAAGAAPTALADGCAARIMTGAPVPHGADTVVPFEDAQVDQTPDAGDHVVVDSPLTPGQHVRRRGEDVTVGDIVLPAGRTLRAADLAAAAAVGHAELMVRRRPRVAVVTTGDETQAPGEPLAPGQVYESNGTFLLAALRRAGARVVALQHCPDQRERLTHLFDELSERADLLLVAGGISAGDYDVVRDVLADYVVHVKMKPGKPQAAGTWRQTPIIALPGNPVSAAASFAVFVTPWLDHALGRTAQPRTARTAQAWTSRAGVTHLLPITLNTPDGTCLARPATAQGSHLVASLALADGWAIVPEHLTNVVAGTTVEVLCLA